MTRLARHPALLIVRREALSSWRDGRFVLAASVVLGLLVLSLASVLPRHDAQAADAERLAWNERQRWLGLENQTPHSAAHHGLYLAKPLSPLAVFDEGVNTYAGVFAHLEPHDQRIFRFRPAEDLTWLRRLGTLTAAATLQQLLPFVIIVLTFGTFASQEARATERLLLSTGVRQRDIVLGKGLGTALPWLTVSVVGAGIGSIALVLANGSLPDLWFRVGLLAASYAAYLMLFVAISLAVSKWAANARTALASLLLFWALSTFLVPALAIEVVERLDPVPAPLEFAAGMNRERYALPLWYERRAALASPLLAVRSLSAGLAGTDVSDHLDFAAAAESYRRTTVQILNTDTAINDLPRNRTDIGVPGVTDKYYQPGRELWEKIPAFHSERPPAASVLGARRPALLVLSLWLTCAVAGCLWPAREAEGR